MNIYVWKILRTCTNQLKNVMNNQIIKQLLSQQRSPRLRYLLKVVNFHRAYLYLQKHSSARISLCQFSEILEVKHKTILRRLSADKSKLKAIKAGDALWSSISK